MKKYFLLVILGLSLVSCLTRSGERDKDTEVLWDKYGVPHIFAEDEQSAYYALGWSQMNNHADLILRLYGQARGKAAEYWGKDFVGSDKKILLFGLPELAEKNNNLQKPEFRSFLDEFVKGMNDYAARHPDAIGKDFRQVLPVTADDVSAHIIRVIYLEFLAGEDLYVTNRMIQPGSNAVAVGPSRSASGKAMLISNPHLPWSDFFTWFEAHLNVKGKNIYGVSLVGMPVLSIAFNDNLGWTHTVNTIDASDRYELILRGDGYLFDGKTEAFTKKTAEIKVRQDDGTFTIERIEFKYSKHGPVAGEKNGKAYAIRIAGLDNANFLEQYHRMGHATNLSEFTSAVKMLQNPMFNIVYADRDGNILYFFNGNVPRREDGDFAFWHGTVDGTSSKYLWTSTHSYEDLPVLLNPETGFVQNCNDPPWTCTWPPVLGRANYPPYMAPAGMGLRPQRAVNMMRDAGKLTFDQFLDYKNNTGMESAGRFLDDLLDAVKKHPVAEASKAADVLEKWDMQTEAGSRGAVLFAAWFDRMKYEMFRAPWSEDAPADTPDGLRNPAEAVKILAEAAKSVEKKYGSLDIAWGDVFRFRRGEYEYPANGGPGDYGIFRTIYYADGDAGKKYSEAGDTYVAIAEFGEKVRARVLLSYGNASQPGNSHNGDQLQLLAGKKMREALIGRKDIEENLERADKLSEE